MATLTLTERIHTCSFEYTPDSAPSTWDIQWKKQSEGTWKTFGGGSALQSDGVIRCVLQFLAAGTAYDFRITNMDTDTTASGQATTETDTLPTLATTEVFVDPVSGDDGTGDGSEGNPYKTIDFVVDNTTGPAGITLLASGSETNITIPSTFGGNSSNWSYIRNNSGTVVSMDVSGAAGTQEGAFEIDCDFLVVYGHNADDLEWKNADQKVFEGAGSNSRDHWRFRNCKFLDWQTSASDPGSGAAVVLEDVADYRVEHCTFAMDTAPGATDITDCISYRNNDGNGMIHDCTFSASSGVSGNVVKDAVGANGESTDQHGPFEHCDIWSNVSTSWIDDDVIEVEGKNLCVSVWDNDMSNAFVAIGEKQTNNGPMYIHHNIFWKATGFTPPQTISAMYKMGEDVPASVNDSDVFFYHNSAYLPTINEGSGLKADASDLHRRHTFKNESLHVGDIGIMTVFFSGDLNTYDYNNWNAHDGSNQGGWRWHDGTSFTTHSSLSAYVTDAQADQAGVDDNSFDGDPLYVDGGAGDLTPGSGSPNLDTGIAIVGINQGLDSFTQFNDSGGTPDVGAVQTVDAVTAPSAGGARRALTTVTV